MTRDPTEEGEYEWGCHTDMANQLAAIADTWSEVYEKLQPLHKRWDATMQSVVKGKPDITVLEVRTVGLAWLLAHGEGVFNFVKQCARKSDITAEPTPEETRDWFCWLYRQFASWTKDK